MIQRLGFICSFCVIAGCATTSHIVGNDAYAMVTLGTDAQAAAQWWCRAYGKVPQLRDQDAAHGTVTYDCVGVFANGTSNSR